MTTALMISEMLTIHDDTLIADIDAAFDAIDREVAKAEVRAQTDALLLDVEWLVDELLDDTVRMSRESLDISLELTPHASERANDHARDEVAEVA